MNGKNGRLIPVFLAIISLGAASAFAAAPTISGFSPTSGRLDATVTITGTNFVAPMTVSFNGVASASVAVISSTAATATVPSLPSSTAPIALQTSGGSVTSASSFTVVPNVTDSATVGPPTAGLTVYYAGFNALETVDLYFDTEDVALGSASLIGAGHIPVSIPADARPGVHWFTAVGRHTGNSAQTQFTVRTSWPEFGFAPNHKAKNRYENVLSASNVIDLDEAWRTPHIGQVFCTPAVVNGIAYACFGDGSIRAFDEITGAQKWSFATGGTTMESSPAVSNGIVYAGSQDHYFYALDAVTGALKWRYETGYGIFGSPNAVNGIVYFGSGDDKVYALNATTGALVWSFATGNTIYSSPAAANGVLYVGSYDDNVYALNAATGAKIWQFATTDFVFASPAPAGGLICVGDQAGIMYGLHASTGAAAWTYSIAGGYGIESSAAVAGGAIFFGCDNGSVYSLSSGGAFRWSTALPNGTAINSPVCVANGVVYATDGSYTYALDQNSGAVLTTLPVGSHYCGPVAVNGAVFAGDLSDGVLARYTPNALLSNFVAPRPDPLQLRPHPLR